MDWIRMPPLAGLRAFAAFAEAGNVVQAGAALNVSHAAISQQLRALEGHLGVPLVDRSGRALVLTAQGQRLARALELGFGAIETGLTEIRGQSDARPLHVSVTPTFASAWLVPRLSAFQALHPEIDLVLDPSPALVRLEPGGVDVAIRYCDGTQPGLDCEPLLMSPITVVAAPDLVRGRAVGQPSDLADLPWLEELGTNEADIWLRSEGAEQGLVGRRIQMPGGMLLSALRDGQGVSAVVRHFVQPDLDAGRLVALFSGPRSRKGYHIVTRPDLIRPSARKFTGWLRRQAADEGGAAS
ncbi:MAG: LysR family transcriptional regulator [Marinibacterium sp.]|nr:LysR family transcriptional regulator [Marinibacterium sp.]